MTGPPDIRFYAGAPLVTASGLRLGSLCVIDREPRELDAEQLNVLCNFAEVVVREIEKDAARVRPAVRAACNSLARPHAPRAGVPKRSGGVPAIAPSLARTAQAYCPSEDTVVPAIAEARTGGARRGRVTAASRLRVWGRARRAASGYGAHAEADERPAERHGLLRRGHYAGQHGDRELGRPVCQRRLVAHHECAPPPAPARRLGACLHAPPRRARMRFLT